MIDGVEGRVADAVGVCEQSFDASQHPDLRRGGERMLGPARGRGNHDSL